MKALKLGLIHLVVRVSFFRRRQVSSRANRLVRQEKKRIS